jgi:hypothetical protein
MNQRFPVDLRVLALSLPLLASGIGNAAAGETCRYEITVADKVASHLGLRVRCSDPALLDKLSPRDDVASAFIERMAAPAGEAAFEIDLSGFAAASRSRDGALRIGASVLVTPSAIMPIPPDDAVDLAFVIAGGAVALSLPRQQDGTYHLAAGRLWDAGEWVFGGFRKIDIPAAPELAIVQLDADLAVSPDDLRRWIDDVAASNKRFWNAVPLDPVLLVLIPDAGGHGISSGRVMAAGGATILAQIGDQSDLAELYEEWVLVHEFLHLGSPLVRDTGIWFNEGIATYFEPILRARAGWKTEDAVWAEWIDWMPRGLPGLAPPGLAGSRRAYWSGALFLLLADIELRQRGDGSLGVEDCLRGILRRGGNAQTRWSTAEVIAACEAESGHGGVFAALAERFLHRGDVVDLDATWRALGVSKSPAGNIVYDETAPLAEVRRAIVRGGRERSWAPIGVYRAAP